jgi:hypothetical protein
MFGLNLGSVKVPLQKSRNLLVTSSPRSVLMSHRAVSGFQILLPTRKVQSAAEAADAQAKVHHTHASVIAV